VRAWLASNPGVSDLLLCLGAAALLCFGIWAYLRDR
jgi:hypothetical protein